MSEPVYDFRSWLDTASKHRLLTAAEERELARRTERGDLVAKEKLITHNVRLVAKIARSYRGQGLEDADLFSEGIIGLTRAVERFDYRRGFKLSTFATHWVKQALGRALADKSRTIRVPVHQADDVRRMRRAESKLAALLECEPSSADVAAALDVPVAEVERLKSVERKVTSLNQPASFDAGSAELGDLLPDMSGVFPTPQDAAAQQCRNETIQEALADLSYRQRRVIAGRFGLEDDVPKTLDELAKLFGVTRERVRQVEIGALQQLREGAYAEVLCAELADA